MGRLTPKRWNALLSAPLTIVGNGYICGCIVSCAPVPQKSGLLPSSVIVRLLAELPRHDVFHTSPMRAFCQVQDALDPELVQIEDPYPESAPQSPGSPTVEEVVASSPQQLPLGPGPKFDQVLLLAPLPCGPLGWFSATKHHSHAFAPMSGSSSASAPQHPPPLLAMPFASHVFGAPPIGCPHPSVLQKNSL